MTATTDIDAIMQAILEEPDDDLHRLAFADWHDEYGDPTRARFIRAQIELARTTCSCGLSITMCSYCELRVTAEMLWRGHRRAWYNFPAQLYRLVADRDGYQYWSRGFVSSVDGTTRWFMNNARMLFQLQPITAVSLADCAPAYDVPTALSKRRWYWVGAEKCRVPHQIPLPLSRLLPGGQAVDHDSIHQALQALSAACVYYGRRLANLEKPV